MSIGRRAPPHDPARADERTGLGRIGLARLVIFENVVQCITARLEHRVTQIAEKQLRRRHPWMDPGLSSGILIRSDTSLLQSETHGTHLLKRLGGVIDGPVIMRRSDACRDRGALRCSHSKEHLSRIVARHII